MFIHLNSFNKATDMQKYIRQKPSSPICMQSDVHACQDIAESIETLNDITSSYWPALSLETPKLPDEPVGDAVKHRIPCNLIEGLREAHSSNMQQRNQDVTGEAHGHVDAQFMDTFSGYLIIVVLLHTLAILSVI